MNKWLAERSDRTVGKGGGASDAKANEEKARVMYALHDIRAALKRALLLERAALHFSASQPWLR